MAATRLILAIETSNPAATDGASADDGGPGVALGELVGEDGRVRVLGDELLRPARGRGGHDDDLIPAIDRLFAAQGVPRKQLAGGMVAVSVGPGGYTGVRVACATGAMLAESSGARCLAVPTARVAAYGAVRDASDHEGRLITLAAKAETAWGQVYAGVKATGSGGLVNAASLHQLQVSGVQVIVADRYLPATMRTVAEQIGLSIVPPRLSPVNCLLAAIGTEDPVPEIDPANLVPIYPREPDAVTLWRNRLKPG